MASLFVIACIDTLLCFIGLQFYVMSCHVQIYEKKACLRLKCLRIFYANFDLTYF